MKWNSFKTLIMIQAFYSFAMTGLVYTMPADSLDYFEPFNDLGNQININEMTEELQDSLQRQKNLPLVELGALVFYSGNIVVDLIFNFLYAIPGIVAFFVALDTESFIFIIITQISLSVIVTVMYILGLNMFYK